MKDTVAKLFSIPDLITVIPFCSGFGVRCDLCDPRRRKSINWNPDKKPAADRCANYLVSHLRGSHGLEITIETARDFVNRVSSPKGQDQIGRTRPAVWVFSVQFEAMRFDVGRHKFDKRSSPMDNRTKNWVISGDPKRFKSLLRGFR